MAASLAGLLGLRGQNANAGLQLPIPAYEEPLPAFDDDEEDMFNRLFGAETDDEIFGIEDEVSDPMALEDVLGDDKPKNHFEDTLTRLKTRRKPARLNEDQCEQRLAALLNIMRQAADDDETAHKQDKPCVAKLRTLPVLFREMNRVELRDGFCVSGGVDVCRTWLSPLEDGTKPNNTVVKRMLDLLHRLPISTEILRASEIGKTIAGIFKDEKQPLEFRRKAEDLISHWLRPMLGLNSSYAVMVEQNQQALLQGMSPSNILRGGLSPKTGGLSPADLGLSPGTSRRFVGTPRGIAMQKKGRHYPVSPKSARAGGKTPGKTGRVVVTARSRQGDASPGTPISPTAELRMAHFNPEESKHAKRQLNKEVNNFVALPDYESIHYRRISKRRKLAIENKDTRKNRINKKITKSYGGKVQNRPHAADTVGVNAINNRHTVQKS